MYCAKDQKLTFGHDVLNRDAEQSMRHLIGTHLGPSKTHVRMSIQRRAETTACGKIISKMTLGNKEAC